MKLIKKFISLLRVLYLQGMLIVGWKTNKGSFVIGTEKKVAVEFEIKELEPNTFIFKLDKSINQILMQLEGKHDAKFVLSMCRVEIALWLQNQFLLMPPRFSVTKPRDQYIYATLI